jgi:hypothetical protein
MPVVPARAPMAAAGGALVQTPDSLDLRQDGQMRDGERVTVQVGWSAPAVAGQAGRIWRPMALAAGPIPLYIPRARPPQLPLELAHPGDAVGRHPAERHSVRIARSIMPLTRRGLAAKPTSGGTCAAARRSIAPPALRPATHPARRRRRRVMLATHTSGQRTALVPKAKNVAVMISRDCSARKRRAAGDTPVKFW